MVISTWAAYEMNKIIHSDVICRLLICCSINQWKQKLDLFQSWATTQNYLVNYFPGIILIKENFRNISDLSAFLSHIYLNCKLNFMFTQPKPKI